MNTGANGWTNSAINAIAPFLVKEEVICYLDDDNWYEPNHIETCINYLNDDVDYVYAMRNFYTKNDLFICQDLIESLGIYENKIDFPVPLECYKENKCFTFSFTSHKRQHIDTNCYVIKRNVALQLSQIWYSGIHNDTNVFQVLKQHFTGQCSQHFSVNYRLDLEKDCPSLFQLFYNWGFETAEIEQILIDTLRQLSLLQFSHYANKYPWE